MNKIWLIIQREYASRVKKKSFLITTLIVPLIFPIIIAGIIYFTQSERDNFEKVQVLVLDESGNFDMEATSRAEFQPVNGSLESAKEAFLATEAYGLLHIPDYDLEDPQGFELFTQTSSKATIESSIESKVERMLEDQRLNSYQIDKEVVDKLNVNISLGTINISSDAEQGLRSSHAVNIAASYFTGFLIYIFMFAYGGQVMQGVIEEKSNKIVEIIISTVKPFQLMMGKILGIALVGLTQVAIWILLISVIWAIIAAALGIGPMNSEEMEAAQAAVNSSPEIQQMLLSLPLGKIIFAFIFYFLGGYLLYGALFAAVGSAVDSPSEAQQFMFPIMIPLIIGIIGIGASLDNPDSSLLFWLSMIPLTSPIAMMGRITYDVPMWELLVSMLLLVAGFMATTWLAGRIYRIGILMHGTKVNYRTLAKWITLR